VALLDAEQVNVHPWVTGELACGNLADRANTLYLLRALPQVHVASEDEVLFFIDKHRIAGKGIGYLDMHLLAAAALGNLKIWTRDKRLSQIASFLGLNAAITP
jgi:predicted nucleic acid-binding protein